MTGALPLDRLQRWMQAVIVHPGTIEEAAAGPAAASELPAEQVGQVIRPSAHLQPLERLEIYQAMYPLRMEEALASDFPALKHFLGDDAFFRLALDYVQVHPSRSFTLSPLGQHLADFLAGYRGLRQRAFCSDLARLERTVAEVFDAPETDVLEEEAIARVPAEAWEGARLVPIAALRPLRLRYPASAYLDSTHDEAHRHPRIVRTDEWVVVYRRRFTVFRQDLAKAAFLLLEDLVAGRTVGQAVAAALKRRGQSRPRAEDLFPWFRRWAASGLFSSVQLG